MRLLIATLLAVLSTLSLTADDTAKKEFTGKVTKDRVRLRLQPHLDSHIFKELHRDDLVLVTSEEEDFYACMPPKGIKAYIFRTYVLDDQVEGDNVNVRLEPDISSPVVCQLSTGDKITGTVAPQNNKWLQISLPENVRFFVAKDFITKAGDETLFASYEKRETAVKKALQDIEQRMTEEFKKPITQVQISNFAKELQLITQENKDLPREVEKALQLMSKMEKEFVAKSIEANSTKDAPAIEKSEEVIIETKDAPVEETSEETNWEDSSWKEKEARYAQDAIDMGRAQSIDEFYTADIAQATTLQGIIKPYNTYIKNRPGDFVLVNPKTNLPVAYLYSTKVPLHKYQNREVMVVSASRPNNNFAFPAYFVFEIRE